MFRPLEPTPSHLTYLIFAAFLIVYALFSVFIRNRLHLSEPPLALLTGVITGPKGLDLLNPREWGLLDNTVQELTRLIAGLQVFAIGLELPRRYLTHHWTSILLMLGPVMIFGWLVCAAFIYLVLGTDVATALIIGACLTPTDPVLASSVISNSRFSGRIPTRIKRLLAAESGCNDGVSFPFLFAGIYALTMSKPGAAIKEWFLFTILWQCALGTLVGSILGLIANKALRFSDERKLIGPSSFLVFYLLLAILSIGIASNLGLDDYLVAFAAGAAFSHDGWFARRTRQNNLNSILDLVVNSMFFVYFGTIIPWDTYSPRDVTPMLSPGKLIGLLALVLLFRRIPIVIALKRVIPDTKTYREALFAGHFGPMGVGGLFLAIEARAQLETGGSIALPRPKPGSPYLQSIELIWPVVTFITMGSTLVHGLSVTAISVYSHFARKYLDKKDSPDVQEPLHGMLHEDSEGEETQSEEDDGWDERQHRISLP